MSAELSVAVPSARVAPRWAAGVPYALVLAACAAVPVLGGDYWTSIAARCAVYWVLVAGLNLVVGFAGQLAIGYVALLTLGAYTASALAEKLGVPAVVGLVAAGLVGAAGGVLVGCRPCGCGPSTSP